MKIAVTGSVGSGKSGVCDMLAGLLGARVLDADAICRFLLLPGEAAWKVVRKRWPAEIFSADGSIDRKELRQRIFSSDALRVELEEILHPLVRDEINREMGLADRRGQHLIVEVPLLFEVGWQLGVDCVVAIYAPAEISVERVTERDGVTSDQVETILGLQMSPGLKADRADYVIDNTGTRAETQAQVEKVWQELLELARARKPATE